MSMKFELYQFVKLIETDETGSVRGRAEYATSEPCYLVRYKDATGKQQESWWSESDLEWV